MAQTPITNLNISTESSQISFFMLAIPFYKCPLGSRCSFKENRPGVLWNTLKHGNKYAFFFIVPAGVALMLLVAWAASTKTFENIIISEDNGIYCSDMVIIFMLN